MYKRAEHAPHNSDLFRVAGGQCNALILDAFSLPSYKEPVYQRAVVQVGFHSLRHSFVSLCAANKVPQVAIMELVGHGSPAMTRLYSHAGDEQKAKAIAALPDITGTDSPGE